MNERKINFICTDCSGPFTEFVEFRDHSCDEFKRQRGADAEIARLRAELAAMTEQRDAARAALDRELDLSGLLALAAYGVLDHLDGMDLDGCAADCRAEIRAAVTEYDARRAAEAQPKEPPHA